MNTPCKILAMAWMALRPLCPNIHADIQANQNINLEKISHFFNFDTIVEEEKRTNLETNIRLLVEEQLKLPSGQNLWKAFQFWENQHPELGFQFEFTLTSSPGAEVVLKNLKNSTEVKEIFCFEIAINKVFAENFSTDLFGGFAKYFSINSSNLQKFLNINMLYRPCLIKLVDSDDPENWNYHLREQELPFFITLAHEFLHVLNQLERIEWILETLGMRTIEELFTELNLINSSIGNVNNLIGNILCLFNKEKVNKQNLMDFYKLLEMKYCEYLKGETSLSTLLGAILPMQNFLAKKLHLKDRTDILQSKYLDLWGDKNNDDFLDEMTVILQSKRKVALGKVVCIGESTFLQEFYDNDSIISWSHFSARDNEFWEKMHVLLEKDYINKVFGSFDLKDNVLYSIYVDYAIEKFNYTHYKIGYSSRKSTKQKIQKIFFLNVENLNNILIILETPDGKREVFVQWNWDTIRTLPKYIIIDK